MDTASSEINQPLLVYTYRITGASAPSPLIQWFSETNQQIRIIGLEAVKTPYEEPSTVKIVPIPHDTRIGDWSLKSLLLVQIEPTRSGSIAMTWLEGISEYGTGQNEDDAKTDLVISLGEYREALEEREESLGDSARRELDYLRKLIERSSKIASS